MENLQLRIINPGQGNFLRRIEWNREEFQKQLAEIAERYDGELNIKTSADNKRAKDDRAALNKMRKEIADRVKQVKAAIMEPFEIFEDEVTIDTEEIDRITKSIDEQVKAYENAEKAQKLGTLRKYWEDHPKRPQIRCALQELTEWDRILNPKWGNATFSTKKACEEIDAAFDAAENNLRIIERFPEDRTIKDILIDKLVQTGSMQEVLAAQARFQEQAEARRRQEEARARREREIEEALRARAEAENAAFEEEKKAKVQAGIEALRARLGAQEPPKQEGQVNNAGEQETGHTEPRSAPQVPDQGAPADRPGGDATHAAGIDRDAQGGQGPAGGDSKKIYKATFWVSGTKEQLIMLREYIKAGGFAGYGSIK